MFTFNGFSFVAYDFLLFAALICSIQFFSVFSFLLFFFDGGCLLFVFPHSLANALAHLFICSTICSLHASFVVFAWFLSVMKVKLGLCSRHLLSLHVRIYVYVYVWVFVCVYV